MSGFTAVTRWMQSAIALDGENDRTISPQEGCNRLGCRALENANRDQRNFAPRVLMHATSPLTELTSHLPSKRV